MISAARVPVFLLDEHQVVQPGKLGTVDGIGAHATGLGLAVRKISLNDQFCCGGSEAYLNWVQRLLGLTGGGPLPWPGYPALRGTADSGILLAVERAAVRRLAGS